MSEYTYFGPLIGKYTVPKEILEYFKKEGEQARKDNNDFRPNLAGQLKEEYYFKQETKKFFVTNLKETFFKYFDYYFNSFGNFVDRPIDGVGLEGLWINYMRKNEFNPPHTHSGNFSFVMYLDVPEIINEEKTIAKSPHPGTIQFMFGEDMHFCQTKRTFRPKTGELFIFPAYLQHYVVPFKSDVVRISMSGNIRVSTDLNIKGNPVDIKHNFNKINFVAFLDEPEK